MGTSILLASFNFSPGGASENPSKSVPAPSKLHPTRLQKAWNRCARFLARTLHEWLQNYMEISNIFYAGCPGIRTLLKIFLTRFPSAS